MFQVDRIIVSRGLYNVPKTGMVRTHDYSRWRLARRALCVVTGSPCILIVTFRILVRRSGGPHRGFLVAVYQFASFITCRHHPIVIFSESKLTWKSFLSECVSNWFCTVLSYFIQSV